MDSHACIRLQILMCWHRAHRSPSVDQQNSSSTVETDQPEDPVVSTKMMPGSKIVLPSSDAEDYSKEILRNTISRITNPKGIILFSYRPKFVFVFLVGKKGKNIHTSRNCPNWWPKDVVFSVRGT